MVNREPFAEGEWYHCFTRGVDKRQVFDSESDYRRFLQCLYLCNDTAPVRQFDDSRARLHYEVLQVPRTENIVSLGAYCLMPNHYHLLLQEIKEGGITSFMRKVGTAYTMYYNARNARIGNLFVKPFRSKIISNDPYFLHIPHYIHLNAAELFEAGWKQGVINSRYKLTAKLREYPYSSLPEYSGETRAESVLLDAEAVDLFQATSMPLDELVADASEYYTGLKW